MSAPSRLPNCPLTCGAAVRLHRIVPASVEDIFRDVAMMTPAPPKDEDPYQSEEYQRFVESMAEHCHCAAPHPRPCDGVLAGGPCDGFENEPDYTLDDLEWEEAYG